MREHNIELTKQINTLASKNAGLALNTHILKAIVENADVTILRGKKLKTTKSVATSIVLYFNGLVTMYVRY